ncbi:MULTISPECIES: NAD(P)-dependent oxidoreductase [Mycolicibacterium]|jgi:3-hydroxyisobutyrate dehydrogenase-like beta-hydroxyacid dehydrogenase|nr:MULTISPECIES: NAD(P)-binding domain-containing protein [Mycolicibacterium]
MTSTRLTVSFLGLGEMGSMLARTAMNAGHETLVWNRTAARAAALVAEGATAAADPAQVLDADLIVVCLFDQASVHEVLDSVADQLAGRRMVNLTTTSPNGARELARWAAGHGADYLDGGIMATPEMIATPQSAILYSGSAAVFEQYRELFELWGSTEYFGDDAGLASLYDLALLSAMYVMFAGFAHGAAMVGAAGVWATEFATRTAAWLPALMPAIAGYATVIDGGDYAVPGQQSLYFSDLTDIVNASRDQGISTEVVDMVQRLIHRQIDAGHGDDGFARIIESIKNGAAA